MLNSEETESQGLCNTSGTCFGTSTQRSPCLLLRFLMVYQAQLKLKVMVSLDPAFWEDVCIVTITVSICTRWQYRHRAEPWANAATTEGLPAVSHHLVKAWGEKQGDEAIKGVPAIKGLSCHSSGTKLAQTLMWQPPTFRNRHLPGPNPVTQFPLKVSATEGSLQKKCQEGP